MVIRMLLAPARPALFDLFVLGVCFGLALLTKLTALPLAVPLFLFLIFKELFQNTLQYESVTRSFKVIVLVCASAFLVSGWCFVLTWMETGKCITTGWDLARGVVWWQDPAVRTPRHFFSFGESLFYPVYSAVASFWDGLYSTFWMDGYLSAYYTPPWNYGFMLSDAWFSLLPTVALLTGVLSTVIRSDEERSQVFLFAVFSVAVYLAALLYVYLTVPFLSTAKATYTLGTLPCYTILFTRGIDHLTRNPYGGAVEYAFFACWVLASYASYFVL